jgi:hypothetical protein
MIDFLLTLRTTVWRTAGARYNAARRLKRREFMSVLSLALLSSLSVAIAFLQRIYSPQGGTPLDNYLTALAGCFGIFLLAISLVEYGARHGAKADSLHQSAEDLTALQQKIAQCTAVLNSGSSVAWDAVSALRVEYDTMKSRCKENHEPIDDRLFLSQRRFSAEFLGANGKPQMNAVESAWVRFTWFLSSVWYLALIWVAAIGAIAGAFCFV